MGAFLPVIKAVQITISIFFNVSERRSSCFFLNSSEVSLAYPPEVSRFSAPSIVKNLPPKLSTCSLDDILTSVAKTIPPILFAVAIACNPATPAPTTKIFAAGIVPAAVIIIGTAFLKFAKASTTALYPAKLACDERMSIDWALVILGSNSKEKTLIFFFDKPEIISLLV